MGRENGGRGEDKMGVGEEGRRRERAGGKIFVRRIIRSKTITTLAL